MRVNQASTPYSIRKEHRATKNSPDETMVVVDDNRRQAILLGYYPVVTYQPVLLPPAIYLSEQSMPCQFPRSTQMKTTMK